jgi:hypothetical protein
MGASAAVVQAAHDMLARGYAVVPVRLNKRPLGDGWRRIWRDDELDSAFKLPDIVGVGFLGGSLSHDIVPIDFDTDAAEAWWQEQHAVAGLDPDDYPTVLTPRPGKHRYVSDVRGTLSNAAGALGKLGIDLRGAGQAILPPSPHPNGGFYAWAPGRSFANFDQIPACPDFVYDAIAKHAAWDEPRPAAAATSDKRIHAWCRKALDEERGRLAGVGSGGRNRELNTAALKLGAVAHYGAFSRGEALAALEDACMRNGLIQDDGRHAFAATFASGWTAGEASPRTVALEDRKQSSTGEQPQSSDKGETAPAGGIRPLLEPLVAFDPAHELPQIVRGVIGAGQAITLIGGPGCGKTTLACLLAVCVASGTPWMGFETEPGPVVYVSAEAPVAAHKRLTAACLEMNLDPAALPIRIMPQALFLDDAALADRVIGETRAFLEQISRDTLSLLILDTFARCIAGADENSAEHIGIAVTTMDRLRAELGCAMVPLHHPSKANPTQGRGSSAMPGAVDGELVIERDTSIADGIGTISPGKPNRDLELFQPVSFRLKPVDLGLDSRGDMVRTVVAVTEGGTGMPPRHPITGQARIAYDALVDAIAAHGQPLPGHPDFPPNTTGVMVDYWRRVFYNRRLWNNTGTLGDKGDIEKSSGDKASQRAFQRAGDILSTTGRCGIRQPFAWLIK